MLRAASQCIQQQLAELLLASSLHNGTPAIVNTQLCAHRIFEDYLRGLSVPVCWPRLSVRPFRYKGNKKTTEARGRRYLIAIRSDHSLMKAICGPKASNMYV